MQAVLLIAAREGIAKMPKKKARRKTPLPDAILKDKEFLRQVDVLIDCCSPDVEKARRAQAAAMEILANIVKPTMVEICSDASKWELLKGMEGRKMDGWKLVSTVDPTAIKVVSPHLKEVSPRKGKKAAHGEEKVTA